MKLHHRIGLSQAPLFFFNNSHGIRVNFFHYGKLYYFYFWCVFYDLVLHSLLSLVFSTYVYQSAPQHCSRNQTNY